MRNLQTILFLYQIISLGALALFAVGGCSNSQTAKEKSEESPPKPIAPQVTETREDLIFSWVGDAGPQVASKVADVPVGVRSEVRVQDPTIPPENRNTGWLYFADLTAPNSKGEYPVQSVERAEYEAKRRADEKRRQNALGAGNGMAVPANPGMGQIAPPPSGSSLKGAPVIMYSTRHCPVCIQARRWLLNQKIPYIEKDIERDRQAAESLAAKGQQQGVSTNGVPIFEIRGQLVPGFDPKIIKSLVEGIPHTQQTI